MADQAVRFFALDRPYLTSRVRHRLERRRDELTAQLVTAPAADYSDYRYRLGRISGVTEAIAICLEAEKDDNRG
jgi:hypothetical protein